MNDLKLVFMGTPEFAATSLRALVSNGFNIAAVVTAPDKPSGRGRKLTMSPVKEFALQNSLPILQPLNLKDPGFIEDLKNKEADLFAVVAFRMLPAAVWKLPSKGTINLHASLLPQYRGAAPINHAIINGETVTGLTTFLIDDQIDTGIILLREEVPILPHENAGDLHDKLMHTGAALLIRTIWGVAGNTLKPVPQDQLTLPGEVLRTAPKINPDFCIIDWNNKPGTINDFIRGLSPYPCARTTISDGKSSFMLKIFEAAPVTAAHKFEPGKVFSDGKNYIRVSCMDGFIDLRSIQPEGKKRMTAAEFLRGFRIEGFVSGS
jgi:methionyl-tRNA formyltransferase